MSPPPVPSQLRMPHGWETVFLVAVTVFSAVALAWAVRRWRTDRDPVPLVMLLAGTCCAVLEPLVDVLGLCWYPRGQLIQAFQLMGRPIPLYVIFGYTMEFGGATIVALELLRRRGPSALWQFWAWNMVFMMAFELFAVHTKTYVYYGPQPLRILDWPIWWAPVNGLVAVGSAVAIHALRPRGRAVLAIVPLVLMVDAGVNGAAGWPVYTALWSDMSQAVRQACGLATCGLAAFGVWLATRLAAHIPAGAQEPDGPSSVQDAYEATWR
ncbi:MAG: hypothetical protein ACYDHH_28395 [Solirubrobacteraceae bacterium]